MCLSRKRIRTLNGRRREEVPAWELIVCAWSARKTGAHFSGSCARGTKSFACSRDIKQRRHAGGWRHHQGGGTRGPDAIATIAGCRVAPFLCAWPHRKTGAHPSGRSPRACFSGSCAIPSRMILCAGPPRKRVYP